VGVGGILELHFGNEMVDIHLQKKKKKRRNGALEHGFLQSVSVQPAHTDTTKGTVHCIKSVKGTIRSHGFL
jgi:hypothetical protein